MEAETPACSRKRARAGAVADRDRLGDLPDCLLHDILSRVGSRQAVQTSALSRRWRHLWRSVPCVNIDQREFQAAPAPAAGAPVDWVARQAERQRQWESFEDFADNMLASFPGAPLLDAFLLHLADECKHTTIDRWIRRGLRRLPVVVDIHHAHVAIGNRSSPNLRLGTGTGTGTSRLTRLRLFGVSLRSDFGEQLGAQFPVLEDLHIERCTTGFRTIASPTLKSLAVVGRLTSVVVVLVAPRLASLRLVVPFGSTKDTTVVTTPENEEMVSLVEASIRITDTVHAQFQLNRRKKSKLDFLKSMCNFLARLPNVRNLDLSGFTTVALLDEESLEFPMFHNLRTLLLNDCDVGDSCQALRSILRNTPSLEKLRLHHCKFLGSLRRKRGNAKSKRTSSKYRISKRFLSGDLKSIEIKHQQNDDVSHLDKVLSQISRALPQAQVSRKIE